MPTRFAPSPTGLLHLGHAFSALTAWDICQRTDKRFILRIEDIDFERCKDEFEEQIFTDLSWLGLTWEEPILRQKNRLSYYKQAIDILNKKGLIYPCSCSRKDINTALVAPHNAKYKRIYSSLCRERLMKDINFEDNIRLNVDKSIIYLKKLNKKSVSFFDNFFQKSKHQFTLNSNHFQNDIIIARKGINTSYHLSVVVDDAFQQITHIVRGNDLFESTPIQRLLQELLDLPEPTYHHHQLIVDTHGKRLAKRHGSMSLKEYRKRGYNPNEIKKLLKLIN